MKSLIYNLRVCLYFIYLIFYVINLLMKVFFNPKRVRNIPSMSTPVPRESDNGIVFDVLSDNEIFERNSIPDALHEDAAFLASKGVEPRSFSGSVISPLDAVDAIMSNSSEVSDFVSNLQSVSDSSSSDLSCAPDQSSSTSNS